MTARDDGVFGRHDNFGSSSIVMPSAHPVRHGLAAVLPAEFDSPVSGRGETSSASDRTYRIGVRPARRIATMT